MKQLELYINSGTLTTVNGTAGTNSGFSLVKGDRGMALRGISGSTLTYTSVLTGVKTIAFAIKKSTNTKLFVDNATDKLQILAGVLNGTGLTASYVNGIATTTVASNVYQFVIAEFSAGITFATNFKIAPTANVEMPFKIVCYDSLLTEQERNKAQADFNSSFPIEKPSFDYQAFKATDLSNEVNNTLGSELIVNGDFSSATGWSLDAGWSISNGTLNAITSSTNAYETITGMIAGKKYLVQYTIKSISNGGIKTQLSGGVIGITRTTIGTYSEILTATTSGFLYITGVSSFTGSIDNVSVRELTGLIAAYNFVPNGNVLTDVSGNGNTGTISKAVSSKEGLVFNGKDSTATVTGSSGLTGDVTISGRVYLNGWGGSTVGQIITSGQLIISVASSGSMLRISRNGNSTFAICVISGLSKWYNFSITSLSSGVSNIYINGVLSGTANQSAGTPVSSTFWNVGNSSALNRGFDGTISDLRIYNRILTTSEIQAYHNQFASRITLKESFQAEGADGIAKVPSGWSKVSGSFKVGELAISNYVPATLLNTDFSTATGWATSATASISNGQAHLVSFPSFVYYSFPSLSPVGRRYRVKIKIDRLTGGTVSVYFTTITKGSVTFNTTGVQVGEFNVSATGAPLVLYILLNTVGQEADIDYIYVEEIPVLPTLKNGSKYLECVTAGVIALPSKQAYGSWELDWYKGADANTIAVYFTNNGTSVYPLTKQAHLVNIAGNEQIILYSNNMASLGTVFSTVASYFNYNTWYRLKITRSVTGVFTVYIKGGAFGSASWTLISTLGGSGTNPGTNNTYTTSEYFVMDLDPGDRITNIQLTDGIVQDNYWTNTAFPVMTLTPTGTGAGVATLAMTASAATVVKLFGGALFYTDAAGTLNASDTWQIDPGASRTIYIKCATASTMVFNSATNITQWGTTAADGWTTPINAPSLSVAIGRFTAMTVLRISGTSNLGTGSLPTGLTYLNLLGASIAWTYNDALPIGLAYLYLEGNSIDYTGLVASGTGNATTWAMTNYRITKMSSADMITLLTSLTNRVGTLPATITINDYADYAAIPADVTTAVNTLKATKSITTVNLGA
jgi:hypothetical protein